MHDNISDIVNKGNYESISNESCSYLKSTTEKTKFKNILYKDKAERPFLHTLESCHNNISSKPFDIGNLRI